MMMNISGDHNDASESRGSPEDGVVGRLQLFKIFSFGKNRICICFLHVQAALHWSEVHYRQ
jgi:hypothetical protein